MDVEFEYFIFDRQKPFNITITVHFFLKKYQSEYYEKLSEVRLKGNYEQWVKFFLNAIDESDKDALKTIDELSALRQKSTAIVKAKTARRVLDDLETCPILSIGKTASALNISRGTASRAITALVNLGILVPTKNVKRNKVFAYKDYLEIFRRDT